MPQSQVRLGDVLDDYCPRERRLSNHVVVALVDEEIKLTRCVTCDSEHPYKDGRVPPRRQKRSTGQVASAGTEVSVGPPVLADTIEPEVAVPEELSQPMVVEPVQPHVDSVRRPLIRATLARPAGLPASVRQAPVFTIRENTDEGRKRSARKHRNRERGNGEPNGNRAEGYTGRSASSSGHGKNGSKVNRGNGSAGRASKNFSRGRRKNRSG